MTVTRHPLFVNADSGLVGLPPDRRLAERLQTSFALLPRTDVLQRIQDFLTWGPPAPVKLTAGDAARLAAELERAIAGLIAGTDPPRDPRRSVAQLGGELRHAGLGAADAPWLIGALMATLVHVAGDRWRMQTITEWAEAVSLLIEAALGPPA